MLEFGKIILDILSSNYTTAFSAIFSMAISLFAFLQVISKKRKKEMDKELLQKIYEINKDLVSKGHDIVALPMRKTFEQFATTSSVILNSKKSLKIKVKPTQKKEQKEKEKEVIISTLFLSQKLKNIYKSYLALVIANVIALLLPFIPTVASVLTIALTILVFLYQQILSYRVKNGLFGSNAYEAQELLEFLVKNQDKIDGNGNGLFNEENLQEIALDMSKLIGKVEASRWPSIQIK